MENQSCGTLVLDELPEFRRDLLEGLRQPLESGEIVVSRIKRNLRFPARFILVAAMNPCPCGYYGSSGDAEKECSCSAYEVIKYQRKISGPLLDRIDIQINVPRVKIDSLKAPKDSEADSRRLKGKVKRAREIQAERFKAAGLKIITNSEMNSKYSDELIRLTKEAEQFLKNTFNKSVLSTRSYYRLLKTARTIADLEEAPEVNQNHVAEAFQLRIREN